MMPHLPGNIPSSLFYGLIFSELLRIVRWTHFYSNSMSQVSELDNQMVAQEGITEWLQKQAEKCCRNTLWFSENFIKHFMKSETQ